MQHLWRILKEQESVGPTHAGNQESIGPIHAGNQESIGPTHAGNQESIGPTNVGSQENFFGQEFLSVFRVWVFWPSRIRVWVNPGSGLKK